MGVVGPDVAVDNVGELVEVGVADDDGTAPPAFAGEVAIVGGVDGGDVVGSVGAEDVVAGVLVEGWGAIAPADADVACGGDEHGGVGAFLAALYLP